jgi:hypothetical protein
MVAQVRELRRKAALCRRAFQLPGRGTPIASLWGWRSSSNAMRRSENKNCEAIDRAEPLIQTLPHLNARGGRAIRSQISIFILLGDDRGDRRRVRPESIEVEQISEVADRRAVGRHIGPGRLDGVRQLSRLRAERGLRPQLRSMNFRIET